MRRFLSVLPVVLALACFSLLPARGQQAGSRAGLQPEGARLADLPQLTPEIAQGYIAIEGRAAIQVRPTELRVVMAVTSEGETAQQCRQTSDATIQRLSAAWGKLGIAPEKIVVDFISLLPRYEWTIEKRGTIDVGIEKRVGYRVQTNVHLAVPGDAEAQAALARAFEQGVTDIIAFDYWSRDLDAVKVKAREQALKAARNKADALLGALFEHRPPVINVQEQTTVRYPESLYQSFTNTSGETMMPSFRRDVPLIGAHRPRNTYYRGLSSDGDVQSAELPMKPEISVVSTVRLYFQSPAAEMAEKQKKKRKS